MQVNDVYTKAISLRLQFHWIQSVFKCLFSRCVHYSSAAAFLLFLLCLHKYLLLSLKSLYLSSITKILYTYMLDYHVYCSLFFLLIVFLRGVVSSSRTRSLRILTPEFGLQAKATRLSETMKYSLDCKEESTSLEEVEAYWKTTIYTVSLSFSSPLSPSPPSLTLILKCTCIL